MTLDPNPVRNSTKAQTRRAAADESSLSTGKARRVTQNDVAYETIKEAILTLRLRPGEHLNASILEEMFRLGRTPVSRALHRLKLERLVEILPRKGIAVTPLSLDDAMNLIEVRRVNEAHCLELAAERISSDELRRLEQVLDRFEASAKTAGIEELLKLDGEFHRGIARASHNLVLAELLDVLHARSQRFWAMSLSRRQHIDEVTHEHRVILTSLKRRNAKGARKAIEDHIESFQKSLMHRANRVL